MDEEKIREKILEETIKNVLKRHLDGGYGDIFNNETDAYNAYAANPYDPNVLAAYNYHFVERKGKPKPAINPDALFESTKGFKIEIAPIKKQEKIEEKIEKEVEKINEIDEEIKSLPPITDKTSKKKIISTQEIIENALKTKVKKERGKLISILDDLGKHTIVSGLIRYQVSGKEREKLISESMRQSDLLKLTELQLKEQEELVHNLKQELLDEEEKEKEVGKLISKRDLLEKDLKKKIIKKEQLQEKQERNRKLVNELQQKTILDQKIKSFVPSLPNTNKLKEQKKIRKLNSK